MSLHPMDSDLSIIVFFISAVNINLNICIYVCIT